MGNAFPQVDLVALKLLALIKKRVRSSASTCMLMHTYTCLKAGVDVTGLVLILLRMCMYSGGIAASQVHKNNIKNRVLRLCGHF